MEADARGVLAEELDGALAEVDALALDLDAMLGELGGDFGGADRAEHLASFTGLDGEDELDGGELGGGRVGGLEVAGFTDFAGLLEGLDVLRVGAVDGERDALREQVVTGEARADADLFAFGA